MSSNTNLAYRGLTGGEMPARAQCWLCSPVIGYISWKNSRWFHSLRQLASEKICIHQAATMSTEYNSRRPPGLFHQCFSKSPCLLCVSEYTMLIDTALKQGCSTRQAILEVMKFQQQEGGSEVTKIKACMDAALDFAEARILRRVGSFPPGREGLGRKRSRSPSLPGPPGSKRERELPSPGTEGSQAHEGRFRQPTSPAQVAKPNKPAKT